MDEGFFLGSPQGHAWPLAATALHSLLRARFPEAPLRPARSGVTGAAALDFDLLLADGETYGGRYSENWVLTLTGGTPQLWAETMVWFLSLLPGEPVYAMREGNPTPVALPDGVRGDPEAIARFFDGLDVAL